MVGALLAAVIVAAVDEFRLASLPDAPISIPAGPDNPRSRALAPDDRSVHIGGREMKSTLSARRAHLSEHSGALEAHPSIGGRPQPSNPVPHRSWESAPSPMGPQNGPGAEQSRRASSTPESSAIVARTPTVGAAGPSAGWVAGGPPSVDTPPETIVESPTAVDEPGSGADIPTAASTDEDSRDALGPGESGGSTLVRLSLVPSRSQMARGDIILVEVVLSDAREVMSVPFHVRFDPDVLGYLGARTGPAFLASGLSPILLAAEHPDRPGDVGVGLAIARSSGSYSGSGTLVVLEFRALNPGESDLLFESASVRGQTGAHLPARIVSSSLRVR